MSVTAVTSDKAAVPERRGWTGEEFERLAKLGFFGPEERLELIDGEIVEKMPQNSPHATAITLAQEAVRAFLPLGHILRIQMPLALGKKDRPEPDLAVVEGSPRDYVKGYPTTAVLVVEVSDTTLVFDQTRKQGVYARAGIPEYWVVNLRDRLLEVHRQPVAIRGYPLGHGYREVLRLTEGETVAPTGVGSQTILVADLLP